MNKLLIIVVVGCVTAGLYFALAFYRPDFVQSFSYSKMYTAVSGYFSSEDNDKNRTQSGQTKEYSFSKAQILAAKNEVLETQKLEKASQEKSEQLARKNPVDKYLYEIEFLSGRTVSARSVSTINDTFAFENDRGLVVSVANSEVKTVRRLSINYSCSGKVYCSEMNSCEEATFYLRNCPGVKMDGDGDGVPCEEQWCVK